MRDFGSALMAALLSIGLTLGALSISLVGFVPKEAEAPTQALILSPAPVTATNTPLPSLTPLASVITLTPIPTNTFIPPTSCNPPAGWIAVSIQISETLDSLAAKYNTSKDILKSGNCLFSESLIPGTILYVPHVVATNTVAICNKGAVNWSPSYRVISGDTLYSIALRYYTTLDTLKRVNCLIYDRINVGDVLWVPNVATRTPSFTPLPGTVYTVVPYLTEPLTETFLPFTATFIPTQTSVPPTFTPIPTQTASPTAFPTPTATP
jgi:LysM repeat protein